MTATVCFVMYNSRVINKNDISLNFDVIFRNLKKGISSHTI